jgi:hypothetical protein
LSDGIVYGAVKKPKTPPKPADPLQLELARLRALHHVHDAARIITDAMPYAPVNSRKLYTSIVGELSTLEQRLVDLETKKVE